MKNFLSNKFTQIVIVAGAIGIAVFAFNKSSSNEDVATQEETVDAKANTKNIIVETTTAEGAVKVPDTINTVEESTVILKDEPDSDKNQ